MNKRGIRIREGLIILVLVILIIIGIMGIIRIINNQSPQVVNIIYETPLIPKIATPSPTPSTSPKMESYNAHIKKNGVNVRYLPNITSTILMTLDSQSIFMVIGESGEWFQIETFDGIKGYINKEFIVKGTPEPTPKPTPIPSPKPTPRYGKWSKEDYLLLATTIYCEADPKGGLEEAVAVGWVIRNRLEDYKKWGDSSWLDVISRSGQFSVYSKNKSSKFQKTLAKISSSTYEWHENAKRAARYVMQDRDKYKIPSTIQFFCADHYYNKVKKSNGNWGSHKFYKQIGGTCFFYK